MNLSLNLLKEYVKIPKSVTPEELGLKLTLHTVEVENIQKQADRFKNVVVGKILEIKKHPNADRLQLAKVDIGKNVLDIVCGAPNIEVGQFVPVATVGAVLPNGLEIKEAEVRGEKSSGMLCAADELGLGDDHAGIMALKKAKLGMSLAEYLGLSDIVFEVDNKSLTNRPDLWGHVGMAREIAAFLGAKKYELEVKDFKEGDEVNIGVDVEDGKLVPNYMALVLDNIKIEASPKWMQDRLIAAGLRPINNIVDITNYVMIELGQPMHAFDKKLIELNEKEIKIKVRVAEKGESLETIDGEKRKLEEGMLVIANQEKILAVAGIMGGAGSEINSDTVSIVLEAANFNSQSIRQTSQKLNLRTDSSMRFEKGLDPNLGETAIKRAVDLIKQVCPKARVISKLAAAKNFSAEKSIIDFDLHWLEKRIGQKIENKEITKILTNLGFEIEKVNSHLLKVAVPTWRSRDISIQEDLMEEVIRIYGYENLSSSAPIVAMQAPAQIAEKKLERLIKNILSGAPALTEVYNYSFVGEDQLKKLNMDYSEHVKLANPISSQSTMLRQNLLANMVGNIRTNQARYEKIGIFEIGSVFLSTPGKLYKDNTKEDVLPYQEARLAIGIAGNSGVEAFVEVKGVIEYLFSSLKLSVHFKEAEGSPSWADGNVCAQIIAGGEPVGLVAMLDSQAGKRSGLKKEFSVAEIGFNSLLDLIGAGIKEEYMPIEKYPAADRDLAFVVDKKILYNEIRKVIFNSSDLIKNVELFDIYEGEKIGKDKKSLAFHITYQGKRTFTSEEIDELQKKLIKDLEEKFEAKIRS